MGSLHTLSTPIAAFVKTVTLPSLRHSKCAGDTLACEATAKGLLTCCNAKLGREVSDAAGWIALLFPPADTWHDKSL
jgi:hypothetical protein